jgi:hypothetical protein
MPPWGVGGRQARTCTLCHLVPTPLPCACLVPCPACTPACPSGPARALTPGQLCGGGSAKPGCSKPEQALIASRRDTATHAHGCP